MIASIVHRYRPGPDSWSGLVGKNDIPSDLLACGDPAQRGRLWADGSTHGLTAGLWESGVFLTEAFRFSGDEFFWIVEGRVHLRQEGRPEIIATRGDCVMVPRGAGIVWEQAERVRKVFMRFDGFIEGRAAIDPAPFLINAAGTLSRYPPDKEGLPATPAPEMQEAILFSNPGGLSIGVWSAAPNSRRAARSSHFELTIFLEGESSVDLDDGRMSTVRAGEAVFAGIGAPLAWRAKTRVKKISCALEPL